MNGLTYLLECTKDTLTLICPNQTHAPLIPCSPKSVSLPVFPVMGNSTTIHPATQTRVLSHPRCIPSFTILPLLTDHQAQLFSLYPLTPSSLFHFCHYYLDQVTILSCLDYISSLWTSLLWSYGPVAIILPPSKSRIFSKHTSDHLPLSDPNRTKQNKTSFLQWFSQRSKFLCGQQDPIKTVLQLPLQPHIPTFYVLATQNFSHFFRCIPFPLEILHVLLPGLFDIVTLALPSWFSPFSHPLGSLP